MRDTSWVNVTVQRSPLGMLESQTYEWRGKSPYIRIRYDVVREMGHRSFPDRIQMGPYRLLKVESYPWEDVALYVRHDRWGRARVAAYRLTRWFDLIYRRTIITLAVWHLADFHEVAVPCWSDIHILRKIFRRAK